MSLTVEAIDHLVINVRDVEISAAWYEHVLGMNRQVVEPKPGDKPRTSLLFGKQKTNLRPVATSKEAWFTAEHGTVGSHDLCFLTQSTPDFVCMHLDSCGVAIEKGPVQKRGATGTLMSVYCRDPDGNLIESSSYPEFLE